MGKILICESLSLNCCLTSLPKKKKNVRWRLNHFFWLYQWFCCSRYCHWSVCWGHDNGHNENERGSRNWRCLSCRTQTHPRQIWCLEYVCNRGIWCFCPTPTQQTERILMTRKILKMPLTMMLLACDQANLTTDPWLHKIMHIKEILKVLNNFYLMIDPLYLGHSKKKLLLTNVT